jgi:hypothetical protein
VIVAVGGLFCVENVLLLVAVYKFGVGLGGHSARGRAITLEVCAQGDRRGLL